MDGMSFEDQLRQLRSFKTRCPAPEQIAAYVNSELASEEALAVQDHVAACGRCDALAVDLRPSAELREPSEIGVEVNWEGLKEAFRTRLAQEPTRGKKQSARRWNFFALLRRPVVAYALSAALLVPAWRGLRPPQPLAPPSPPVREEEPKVVVGSARALDLGDPQRSQLRGSAKQAALKLAPKVEFLALSFFVPIQSAPRWSYRVDLFRSGESVLGGGREITSQDGLGNFTLVLGAVTLAPGPYQLRITETDAETEGTIRSFHYAFSLTR